MEYKNLISQLMVMFCLVIFLLNKINNLEKNIKEKFTTTSSIDNELDSKIEQKVNAIYNMDIEAIRNLGAIAKSIMTSSIDDPSGVITFPSNVIIKGYCKIEGQNDKGYSIDSNSGIIINGSNNLGQSIRCNGGGISIYGKTNDNVSLYVDSASGGRIYFGGNLTVAANKTANFYGKVEMNGKVKMNKDVEISQNGEYTCNILRPQTILHCKKIVVYNDEDVNKQVTNLWFSSRDDYENGIGGSKMLTQAEKDSDDYSGDNENKTTSKLYFKNSLQTTHFLNGKIRSVDSSIEGKKFTWNSSGYLKSKN